MVTIGNSALPGVTTTVESAPSTSTNAGAAAQVGVAGPADFTNGSADPDTVYRVSTPVRARSLFGDDSILTHNIIGALIEGAYPVYAAAPAEVEVVGEDISTLSTTSGTLVNAPVVEDPSRVTFTNDGNVKTTYLTLRDPATENVAAGEAYYNPSTGAFELDEVPGTTATVDYVAYDYTASVTALVNEADVLDVVGVVTENEAAVDDLHQQVSDSSLAGDLAVAIGGPATYISDTAAFTNRFDSSRIAQIYPSRNADEQPIVGAYLGLLARVGIDSSPMFKRLRSETDLYVSLSQADQEELILSDITPLVGESSGARVVEDLTSVSPNNTEEAQMQQVLHRLIVDFVTVQVNEVSESYIGELHTASARNSLRSNIVSRLSGLMDQNSITGYSVTVEEVDAMTASVDVGVELVNPLRNIEATVAAGAVQ